MKKQGVKDCGPREIAELVISVVVLYSSILVMPTLEHVQKNEENSLLSTS